MITFKLICLFMAVFLGIITVAKMVYRDDISVQMFFLLTVSIVGFVVIQFELYK